jgi:hypothetical protein
MHTRNGAILAVLTGFLLASGSTARAVDPTGEPAYFTDYHGSVAAALCFESVSQYDEKYKEHWKGALDWLVATGEEHRGAVRWPWLTNPPQGHHTQGVYFPSMFYVGVLLDGYEEFKDPVYLETAKKAAEHSKKNFFTRIDTAYGQGLTFNFRGHEARCCKFLDGGLSTARLAKATGDAKYRECMIGLLRRLRDMGIQEEDSQGRPMLSWTNYNDKTRTTGWCHGIAGALDDLYAAAEAMPDFRFPDGVSILDMAFQGLNYLGDVAVEHEDGITWMYIRHYEGLSDNIGRGSGTSGIGYQFLIGARKAKEAGRDEDAARYLEIAHRVGQSIVKKIERGYYAHQTGAEPYEGKIESLPYRGGGVAGACGGISFAARYLGELIKDTDDETQARLYRHTALNVADRIVAARLPQAVGSGWLANSKFGVNVMNNAVDYGSTGIVITLTQLYDVLGVSRYLEVAYEGADCLIDQAVEEEGGHKWAQIVPMRRGTLAPKVIR